VWKLRAALQWSRVLPFVIGGIIGVPLGAEILHWASSSSLRMAVGALLVLFGLYTLFRPKHPPPVPAGSPTVRSASSTA
jgi:uncharacterized protein